MTRVTDPSSTPGQRGDGIELDRSIAHELLRAHGCPACAHAVAAVDRHIAWFMAESYAFPETGERLRASLGFCPLHTRRVIVQPGAAARVTRLYPSVLVAARAHSLATDAPPSACPACASGGEAEERAVELIAEMLCETAVARRFADGGGFCLRHTATAVRLRPSAWRAIVAPLVGRLDGAVDEELICGRGDDNPALRAAMHGLLPSAGLAGTGAADAISSLSRAAERLAVDACPVCLAYGQMIRRYLSWLTGVSRREPGALRTEAGGLCPDHLRELTAIDADAGAWALRRERDRVRARLAETRTAPPGRPESGWAARHRRRAADTEARTELLTVLVSRRCLACDAASAYARAERDLLGVSLRDPGFARAYERAHGLCVRHAAAIADDAGPIRRVLAARLDVCAWELAEANRKRTWMHRHEAAGPECTAWVRAPALLDGEVFLGGPARVP